MFNTSTLSTNQSEPLKMNTSISHAFTLAAALAAMIGLTACQSAPQTATNSATATPAELQSISAKQQEYDKLLQEWKTLKPGLTRLVVIEAELNLLIGQLEQLSSSLEQDQQQKKLASNQAPAKAVRAPTAIEQEPIAPVAYAVKVEVPKLVSTPVSAEPIAAAPTLASQLVTAQPEAATPAAIAETESSTQKALETASISAPAAAEAANFALQVASITDAHLLPHIWAQMTAKNPNLLADMEPNFQKTNVKNTDYYRLKIGSFSTQQAASQKCSSLKAAGVDCLVVGYTGSNFAQLTDTGKKITASVALQP